MHSELEWWDINPCFRIPCSWLLSPYYANTQRSEKIDNSCSKAQILVTTSLHSDEQVKRDSMARISLKRQKLKINRHFKDFIKYSWEATINAE